MPSFNASTSSSSYFSYIPIEIFPLILNYLLPEELGSLSQCNRFFNEIVTQKILPYKKLIHFGKLGASLNDNKTFKEWYQETYQSCTKNPQFVALNLNERKLFSQIKEGIFPSQFAQYMHLKDSAQYSLKEWAAIQQIEAAEINFSEEELKELFMRIILNNHFEVFDAFIPYVPDSAFFTRSSVDAQWLSLTFIAATQNLIFVKKMAMIGTDLSYTDPQYGKNIFHYAARYFSRSDYEELIKLVEESSFNTKATGSGFHQMADSYQGLYPVHCAARYFNQELLVYFYEQNQINLPKNRFPYLTPLGSTINRFDFKLHELKDFSYYEKALTTMQYLIFHSNLNSSTLNHQLEKALKIFVKHYAYFFNSLTSVNASNRVLFNRYIEINQELIIYLTEKISVFNSLEDELFTPLYGLPLVHHQQINPYIPVYGFCPRLLLPLTIILNLMCIISAIILLGSIFLRFINSANHETRGRVLFVATAIPVVLGVSGILFSINEICFMADTRRCLTAILQRIRQAGRALFSFDTVQIRENERDDTELELVKEGEQQSLIEEHDLMQNDFSSTETVIQIDNPFLNNELNNELEQRGEEAVNPHRSEVNYEYPIISVDSELKADSRVEEPSMQTNSSFTNSSDSSTQENLNLPFFNRRISYAQIPHLPSNSSIHRFQR